MSSYRIALIPGDGIGNEVVPAAVRVLDKAAALGGFELKYQTFSYSCELYTKEGHMMPPDALERLRDSDSIFLGAVGYPGVPDHVSLWGLLIPIRRGFEQYAPNVGLVYRELAGLDTQCGGNPGDCIDIPWEQKAEKGFIVRQTLLEFR